MSHKIAILGDFNPAYSTHHALNKAAEEIKSLLPEPVQFNWTGTDTFYAATIFETEGYKGLWIAPGSPYKDEANVLRVIRYAREHGIPTLGNCGGFQFMLIEYAKNVCGIEHADHEESNPGGKELLITKLSCSLVAQEEEVTITGTGSLLYRIIKKEKLTGKYFCSYGLNNAYAGILKEHGVVFTAFSPAKEVRAFELTAHPFFLGTLFQPALTSSAEAPDPVILAFVQTTIQQNNSTY